MDYMSDEFINQANDFEKTRKKTEKKAKKPKKVVEKKSLKDMEKDKLEEGLTTPIDGSNKGFQLLMKMGYKQGSGLGKTSTGIQEPLPLHFRKDRSGVGDLKAAKESERFDPNTKKRKLNEEENHKSDFKKNQKLKIDSKKTISSIIKIVTQICPQLDEQKEICNNHLLEQYSSMLTSTEKTTCSRCGQMLVVKTGRFGSFYSCPSSSCSFKKEYDKEEGMDMYVYLSNLSPPKQKERLEALLVYLRETHIYCFYCGATYDDQNQLDKLCPGLTEEDH